VYYGPTKARMMFGDLPIIEAHAQAQLRVSSCAHLSLLFLSLAALSLSSPPPPVATHTSLARLCLPEALSSSGRLPHPLPRLYWYRTLLTRGEFFFFHSLNPIVPIVFLLGIISAYVIRAPMIQSGSFSSVRKI
jgi:hypothetical protein